MKEAPMLTSQRHCIPLKRVMTRAVLFEQTQDELGEFCHAWWMPISDWEDCGKPTVITITMEPRDVLNEP